MSISSIVTAGQLLHMPHHGYRYELIEGDLKQMSPAGWRHGMVGGRLQALLSEHVRKHGLGAVLLAETGFLLARDPDTVRAPDIAFLSKERLASAEPDEAFWPGDPDLAVEVVSPGDTTGELDEKVNMWLNGGAAVVWVVNAAWRTVTVYRSPSDIQILTASDILTGDDVVPGFRCELAEIFG